MINIIKYWWLIFLAISVLPEVTLGQYVNLRLDYETESTVKTEQDINFGTFPVNSGKSSIMPGDVGMGVFSINAIEGQELLIRTNTPESLTHQNPAIEDLIPASLEVQYAFSRTEYKDSHPLKETYKSILIEVNPDPGPWNNLYIFLFGDINIGNITPGTYTTSVILNIDYL